MNESWQFIEVGVEALTLTDMGFVLLLKGEATDRALSIFIGAPEAHSIALALQGETFPRPLTHDLFHTTLSELGASVVRVQIVFLQEQTFHALLVVESGGTEIEIDARPSDAIALALRFEAPVLVREDIWEAASAPYVEEDGVTPDPRGQLQKRLEQALEAERYEEAARLRDELRRLDGDN